MRRAVACALAAALLLVAASSRAQSAVRVALLPVVVHSIERSDYLQRGIADMLATRLEQNPALTVIRVQDAGQATLDPAAARKAAQGAGAAYVVFGSFTQFGEGASLDLRCVSVQGGAELDPRSIFVHAGAVGEIIPRLGDVADRVARYVTTPDAATPAVATGPAGARGAPQPVPASNGALQDALSELDELRERVERLESLVQGRGGARPGASGPTPAQP